ncbi:MAG TPA: WcaF family extracellular polysaccharide biosynthesis acetyltransferase, partial [Tepidisphaeraceae bacterium]|nr:WcaF family extracellular polysaccharide biosynthesis acetyltransferase [Tepidisphaeraceae bacterium]
ANIAECLASCRWCDDVHVLDYGSIDRTCEIAREMGAHVHVHSLSALDKTSSPVRNWFASQRNWAIENIQHKYNWAFHLDADERFTPELVQEMQRVIKLDPVQAGFYVPNKLMFMDRWLKHASGYPIYQMRLFHLQRMRFREFGHGQREDTEGEIGWMKNPYLHYNFSRGLYDWLEKHNRYSTLEAEAVFAGRQSGPVSFRPSLFGNRVQRRRYFKINFYPKLPGKWVGRFIWMYIFKLGFMDGLPGLYYCLLMAAYDLFTTLKLAELKYLRRRISHPAPPVSFEGLAEVEAPAIGKTAPPPSRIEGLRESTRALPRSTDDPVGAGGLQGRSTSPWTLGLNIRRLVWMLVRTLLFRPSFHNWYAWRRFLLRRLGATIGHDVRIRPTARIEMPWNLHIGDHTIIGDHAIIYSLGTISIGRLSVISQYAHVCAGTHDYMLRTFPLLTPPIRIGDEVWIAADAFVGPGVTIGDRTVLGARASAFTDLPADVVAVGTPAKPIKVRELASLA